MRLGWRLVLASVVSGIGYWLARYLRPKHSTLVLNDKVVMITGASSGIGRALAFAFARRGARVVLAARNEDRLEAVRREIEPYTSDVLIVPTDVTDEMALIQLVEQVNSHFGRIDILVNNSGMMVGGPLVDQEPERIENMLRVNVWAAIRLTQLVLPGMLARHHGYIMNIGSAASRTAAPLLSAYTASKYGLAGFTDALRRELAGTGVHLLLVLPGWTHTDMLTSEIEDLVERYGFEVEHPDIVAERAVLALVHGDAEVTTAGPLAHAGMWAERLAPGFVRLYWRLRMTPEWIDRLRQLGRP